MTDESIQNEAQGVLNVSVEWGGHSYTVPASLDLLDLDELERLVDGTLLEEVRVLLGAEQWALLKQRSKGKPHQFVELRTAISDAMGAAGSGESSASSD